MKIRREGYAGLQDLNHAAAKQYTADRLLGPDGDQ